ncbi:MAG: metal ABC transporter permease [Simkaniaceae bacterium]
MAALSFFLDFFHSPFLLMAFFAGCLSSVASGIVGSYVVIKRIVFIGGSIAHSVLGGMGLFLYVNRTFSLPWLNPLYGALLFAILSAYIIGFIHLHFKEREDTVIAAVWAFGMSIGVIFTSLTPGYNVELINFLFGNILWTTKSDLYLLLGLDILLLTTARIFHRHFLAICFDEHQARLQVQTVDAIYFLLLSLIAVTIVLLIQVIGAILVIAMLCLPPAIANLFTKRISHMMPLAILLGVIFTFFGLYFSFLFNWPPGATIAVASTSVYLLCISRQK